MVSLCIRQVPREVLKAERNIRARGGVENPRVERLFQASDTVRKKTEVSGLSALVFITSLGTCLILKHEKRCLVCILERAHGKFKPHKRVIATAGLGLIKLSHAMRKCVCENLRPGQTQTGLRSHRS